jgi:hypothetical protein
MAGAVVLDCIDEPAKAVDRHWDFCKLPRHPQRLCRSGKQLDAMMEGR